MGPELLSNPLLWLDSNPKLCLPCIRQQHNVYSVLHLLPPMLFGMFFICVKPRDEPRTSGKFKPHFCGSPLFNYSGSFTFRYLLPQEKNYFLFSLEFTVAGGPSLIQAILASSKQISQTCFSTGIF